MEPVTAILAVAAAAVVVGVVIMVNKDTNGMLARSPSRRSDWMGDMANIVAKGIGVFIVFPCIFVFSLLCIFAPYIIGFFVAILLAKACGIL